MSDPIELKLRIIVMCLDNITYTAHLLNEACIKTTELTDFLCWQEQAITVGFSGFQLHDANHKWVLSVHFHFPRSWKSVKLQLKAVFSRFKLKVSHLIRLVYSSCSTSPNGLTYDCQLTGAVIFSFLLTVKLILTCLWQFRFKPQVSFIVINVLR